MKSLMLLWQEVAKEFGDLCSVSTTMDVKTVHSRFEHEGLSFLAITLPQFCTDFQKSLSEQVVSRDSFQGFTWRAGLPQFLGGFLDLVFSRSSGVLLDDPLIEAIQAVRQLTLLYGKLELPAADRRRYAAMKGFVECEQEVKRADACRTLAEKLEFRQVSDLLWNGVIQRVDNDLYRDLWGKRGPEGPRSPNFVPKHGPGATADRLLGNEKFDSQEWTERLEKIFPYGEYQLPNWRYYYRLDRVDFLEPGAERPVRVITVPKTMKTPRIIAIEPSYMQYTQQGLKDMLVPAIQDDEYLGGVVGFDDQWRNNHLAKEGSLTGSLATLDLSEASDRVSNQLVREMLRRHPLLLEAVDATRSRKADVPGFGVLRLAKFASMGSALTFPIEAMVFTTVVYLGIQWSLGHRLKRSDISSLRGRVRVYGDDIIVPVEYAKSVVHALELFGFKVNVRKSFLTGKFRESCGKEFYDGHDVSVVRVRRVVYQDGLADLPSSRKHVREIESTVALRNRFYLSGLWRTAAWLDSKLASLLGGYFPTVVVTASAPWVEPSPRSHVLGRWSVCPFRYSIQDIGRIHPAYHVPLVRGWVVSSSLPSSKVSGVGALLKVLNPKRELPFEDPQHLERAGRPDAVRMKLRWTPID